MSTEDNTRPRTGDSTESAVLEGTLERLTFLVECAAHLVWLVERERNGIEASLNRATARHRTDGYTDREAA